MTDVIETAKILSALPVQIVKLHSLYIPKGSKMYEEYKEGKITLCDPRRISGQTGKLYLLCNEKIGDRASIQQKLPKEDASFSNWGISWWKLKDRFERSWKQMTICKDVNLTI